MAGEKTKRVICTKWGDKFGSEEVNLLYRMVRKYSSGDLAFTCLTDDASGLSPEITAEPLPDVPVVGGRANRGWRKLALVSPDRLRRDETLLYLDLDIVLVDSIDPLFESSDGDFRVIKDYKRFRYRHSFTGNTSVLRFTPLAFDGLYEELHSLGEQVFEKYRNEQELLSDFARRRGFLNYWPRSWCASYKHDCVQPLPLGWYQNPRIPEQAKVLVFHGDPKPSDAVAGGIGSKWYRPIRPAPWLQQYLDVSGPVQPNSE